MDQVKRLIHEKNLLSHLNEEVLIVNTTQVEGLEFAKELLYRTLDLKALLLLSGGRTPKELYEQLAEEEVLTAGTVGQIDERYGEPLHDNSNQKMIAETGLLRLLHMIDISFYPMLKGLSRENTAIEYDKTLRELFGIYQRTIGVLGIGQDGHTAGLPAQNSKLKIQNSKGIFKTIKFVVDYNDEGGFYNERITMTFAALSMLDLIIVLVFGDDKMEALEMMFEEGSEEEIPARFYKRPEIAKKTVIITDQQI